MIKFIPKIVPINSILSDRLSFVNNAKNKSLSPQLENRFKNVFCPNHLNIDSIVLCDFKENGSLMKVQSYCCNTFKQTLDLIVTERYPLPTEHD